MMESLIGIEQGVNGGVRLAHINKFIGSICVKGCLDYHHHGK